MTRFRDNASFARDLLISWVKCFRRRPDEVIRLFVLSMLRGQEDNRTRALRQQREKEQHRCQSKKHPKP